MFIQQKYTHTLLSQPDNNNNNNNLYNIKNTCTHKTIKTYACVYNYYYA